MNRYSCVGPKIHSNETKQGGMKYGHDVDLIENPGHVDESLWTKAKEAASKSGYRDKYAVVTEIYKKMGGTFSHKK